MDDYERELRKFDDAMAAFNVTLGFVVVAIVLITAYLFWLALR